MEKLFDKRTSVIYQSPDPVLYKIPYKKRRWILLPVIAYKVLVPYPSQGIVNFFQEIVLKIFQSGNKTADHIASTLLLNKELVEFIIKELIEKHLLTPDGLVTTAGQEVLNDQDQDENYDLKIGYVFYDIYMKSFWDAFVFDDELQFVESPFGDNRRTFKHGKVGNPHTEQAAILKTDIQHYPDDPSNKIILSSIIRHKRRMRNLSRGGFQEETEAGQLPDNLKKVRFLGEKTPFYIPTYLFMPEEHGSQTHWQVCHPFQGGISRRLRDTLDQLVDEQPLLKEQITDLINSTLRVSDLEMEMVKNDKNIEAYHYIISIFSEKINDYPTLLNGLIEFFGLFKDILNVNRTGKNSDVVQAKYRDFINKSYEVLEEALFLLKEENNNYFKPNHLQNRPLNNATILSVFAEQCGFIDNKEAQVFQNMLSVNKGSVEHGNKELRTLLAINLLIAKEVNEHAFYKLAQQVPPFIMFLQDLKKKRDASSHSNETNYTYASIEKIFPRVMFCISHMFDGLLFLYDKGFSFQHMDDQNVDNHDDANLVQRLYHLSENHVEENVGKIIREFSLLKTLLNDVEVARRQRKADIVLKSTKALEEIFRMIISKVLDPNAVERVKDDMQKNLRLIQQHIGIVGFQFKIDKFPQTFTNVAPRKIRKEFKNPKVLSTKIYTTLFSSLDEPSEILIEIASAVPDFIHFSTKVNDRRGHGNDISIKETEIDEISNNLYFIVRNVLPILKKHELF